MSDGLVGRDGVVDRVVGALACGPVVLRGLPGIGRSAVLEAALERRPGSTLLRGVALLASVPHLPLRVARPDLHLGGGAARVAERLADALPTGHLVALDDAQWCDPDTLAVVGELALRRPVLVTVRVAAEHAAGLVSTLAEIGEVVDLEPLDDEAARRLVGRLRPGAMADDIERAVAEARGNPLELRLSGTGEDLPVDADRAALAVASLPRSARSLLARLAVGGTPRSVDREEETDAEELAARGLLVAGDPGTWLPRNERVAAAALAAVDPDERAALHRASAASSPDAAVRTVHLLAAGDLDAARCAADEAAAHAQTIDARATALRAVADATVPVDVEASRAAAVALSLAGRYQEAIAVVDRCPEVAERPDGAAALARSCWAVTRLEEARAAIARGLAARADGPEELDVVAELHGLASRIAGRVDFDLDLAVAEARRGIEVAPGPGRGMVACRSALGLVQLMTGDPAWVDELDEAGRLAVAEEDLHNAVNVYDASFFGHLLSGDPQRCAAIADRAVAATEGASGAWNGYFRAVALLARIHVFADAPTVLAESDLLQHRGLTVKAREAARTARIFALLDVGRDLDALELAEVALATGSDGSARAVASWAAAEAAWIAGEWARAAEVAMASLALGADGFPGTVNAALLGLWAQSGLGIALDPALVAATRSGFPNQRGAQLEAEALTRLADDPAGAAERFEAAGAAWTGRNRRAALRAAWGATSALGRAGLHDRRDEALRRLELEIDGLEVAWARRRIGAGRRAAGQPAGRTGSATEVLARVARGQSSAAIARSLQLSTATIESHLRGAMRRTGARTRLQAAALASTAEGTVDLTVLDHPDGRTVVRSASMPAAPRTIPIEEVPDAPWQLAADLVVTGRATDEGTATRAVLAVVRGAAVDLEVPPGADPWRTTLVDALRQVGRTVAGAAPGPDLEATDDALVALLAGGATVTEAAEALGYSRRSVQRRLAALRAATGAGSNREAVLRAATPR